ARRASASGAAASLSAISLRGAKFLNFLSRNHLTNRERATMKPARQWGGRAAVFRRGNLVGKLALVLVSLAALGAAIAACGEEEEATPGASNTAGTSETPARSATPGESPTLFSSPGTLAVCPTPDARTYTYEPATSSETKEYRDDAVGYTAIYPAQWTICQAAFDDQIRDFSSGTELFDSGGLLRVSIHIYENPLNLTLEEWIKNHNSVFFDRPPETRTIAGVSALVAPLNFEGRPAPHTYLQHKAFVLSIKGLTTEDFDTVASRFSIR